MRVLTEARLRVREHRGVLLDLLVAVVATVAEFNLLADGSRGVDPAAGGLTALAGGLLLFRRRAPLLVLAGTAACAAVLVVRDDYPGGAPVLVALAAVAEVRERSASLVALVPAVVLMQAGAISSPPVTVGAWAVGAYVQARRRYTAALEERAAHLEREREQLNQIAVQQERALIARELHDVVAHSVTVMLLGVRGARDCLRAAPDTAEDTLRRVETSAEQSIDELRRILRLLRDPDQEAEFAPAPGLSALPELVDRYRTTGLPVQLTAEGEPRPLPGGIELSVYRIVQESLTNVLKHSRPTRVTVRLRFGVSTIEVQIEDDGPPSSLEPVPGGHGIPGMRERVAALGGRLEIGRRAGGFGVRASLPVPVLEAR